MHRILFALAAIVLPLGAFAQEHHHDVMSDADFMRVLATMSSHGAVVAELPEAPNATTTINMTAKSFSFTPSTFTVNQGDTVTINLSVPSNDDAAQHGILMDTYINPGQNVNRGQTRAITFHATTAGQFAFGCNVPSCGSGHSNMFGVMTVNAVTTPAPAITSIAPSSGDIAGGTVVTITGTNFSPTATVKFGSTPAINVDVTSSTSITATTPAAASAGAVAVTVTNADNQNGILFNGFTYTAAPLVSAIAPNNGPTSGGTPVTVTGRGFQTGATVTIGGAPLRSVVVVSSTTITGVTTVGPANEEAGIAADVVVHNPDGTTLTLSHAFTWSIPNLAITAITPNS
ncbi:MAG TPA: IPT/TIG domain-containing protein, partial [Vicinamibacterales bacterium]